MATDDQTSRNSDLRQFTDPTVYQVPVKNGDSPIQTNFERTVIEGVPRSEVEAVYDPPIEHDTLRVWGNQEDEPATEGDCLLFADREGRRGGAYTIIARVAHATVLDQETAAAFTNAVGRGDVTDVVFPHVMFLEPIYEAELDRESFWDILGFKRWSNDTFSAINFDRDGSTFHDEYTSTKTFIDQIQGQKIYPTDTVSEYDSLEHALEEQTDREIAILQASELEDELETILREVV